MLYHLVGVNYAAILIYIFMMTFLLSNVIFEKRVTRLFMVSINTVLVLTIADSIETVMEALQYPTMLRVWVSAIGYTVRPLSILYILLIPMKENNLKKYLLVAPAVINGLISFSALFTDVAFSYSETNEFVRGPLGFSAYVVSAIYLIALIIETVKTFKAKNYHEAMVVLDIILMSVVSIFLEAVYKFEGFINVSMAVSITFYYLYYYSQTYKIDPLTRALSRRSFDLVANKDSRNITAVISIDLNDLKVLNDKQGHAEGDKALVTLASCVEAKLLRKCRFYRVGGDEFMIVCFKINKANVISMVEAIKTEVGKTPYACAIGVVFAESGESFKTLCDKVDIAMYEEKERMKGRK